jgi:hypothetical protein
MSDMNGSANGAEKTNGAGHPAAALPMAIGKERPAAPAPAPVSSAAAAPAPRPTYDRTHSVGAIELDALGSLGARNGAKLQATTRVMNAFIGYLVTACGRAPDQLTESDVVALGSVLATLDKIDAAPRRSSMAS